MGLAKGIFVVDTHTHAQRHAYGVQRAEAQSEFSALGGGMSRSSVYDNSPRMLYHMDRYDVDVAVISPAFGMTNALDAQIVKEHPDRFVAFVLDEETSKEAHSGGKPWTIGRACDELRRWLDTGYFVGIGEGLPGSHGDDRPGTPSCPTWNERFDNICKVMELAREYKVVVTYHSGFPTGYAGGVGMSSTIGHYEIDHANPLLCHQVAAAYPDVNIILEHAGIEGTGYRTDIYEECLTVARSHHNVYLECGQWWAELYKKPLSDPNIGAEKLVWGTDWGAASSPQSWMPGCQPETFCDQNINIGIPAHQIDVFGWSLREVGKLNIPQDDLNLILGGNAVKLMNIKTPFTRLFKQYIKKD